LWSGLSQQVEIFKHPGDLIHGQTGIAPDIFLSEKSRFKVERSPVNAKNTKKCEMPGAMPVCPWGKGIWYF